MNPDFAFRHFDPNEYRRLAFGDTVQTGVALGLIPLGQGRKIFGEL